MRVVSDTSPICYLFLVGCVDLLPTLFEKVFIPRAVEEELRHPRSPRALRAWMDDAPEWLKIKDVSPASARDLGRLHRGEREAILLAEDLSADLLILDDREARRVAQERGMAMTGLLGVLDQAAERGLVSLPDILERLRQTSFRAEPKLLKLLLDRHL